MIAAALEVEEIHPEGWSLVQDHLRGWIGNPAGMRSLPRDPFEEVSVDGAGYWYTSSSEGRRTCCSRSSHSGSRRS